MYTGVYRFRMLINDNLFKVSILKIIMARDPFKISLPKINKNSLRVYVTKVGDRTLTPSKKRKLKEAVGFRCQICGKKKPARYLEIHHKKGVAKHKDPYGLDAPVMQVGKKYIPKYDRHKSNLQVICIDCHDKTKKKKVKKKKQNEWRLY